MQLYNKNNLLCTKGGARSDTYKKDANDVNI